MFRSENHGSKGVLKVKNKQWIASFAFCLITTLAGIGSVSAQTRVAIVDIGAVFKSHPEFPQQLEMLKQEAEQFKADSVAAQQRLVQKSEILKQYAPGSPDFKKAESSLAQESAALEVEQRDQMRKLMQREAQLHFETYAEVNEMIGNYCEQREIQLVLRFNGQPMDPKVPGTIMQKVNGSIIYYQPEKDITQQIIAQLVQLKGSASLDSNPQLR